MRRYRPVRTLCGTWPTLAGATILLLGFGCGGSTPKPEAKPVAKPMPTEQAAPDEPAAPEPLETGKDCATAMAQCGEDGVCTAKVQNNCKDPITCELSVQSGCRMENTTGEARASNQVTVRAGEADEVSAWGDCEGGSLVFSEVVGMDCK